MNTTMTLLSRLTRTQNRRQSWHSVRLTPTKVSRQRSLAEYSYKKFTNLTKEEQLQEMRKSIQLKNPEWKYDYYRSNNSFNAFQYDGVEDVQKRNKKYIKDLAAKNNSNQKPEHLKFNLTTNGFFSQPKDKLYSKHYIPIVRDKRKYNEDYELRSSKFGKIWVDFKREKIMDQYTIQVNPFSTARSNQLICLVRPARKHRFS